MIEVEVSGSSLRAVAQEWEDQSEQLGDARRELLAALDAVPAVGPRVAPALTGFLTAWADQVERQAQAAERHGEALTAAAADYSAIDAARAEALRALLPWTTP